LPSALAPPPFGIIGKMAWLPPSVLVCPSRDGLSFNVVAGCFLVPQLRRAIVKSNPASSNLPCQRSVTDFRIGRTKLMQRLQVETLRASRRTV
jgi:hypothetical protein